jgi:hypothetical protein
MSDVERIWRDKSNEDLIEAAAELGDYTDEGQRAIRAGLERRGLEDPVEQTHAVGPGEGEEEEAQLPDCLRCRVELRYLGAKRFHEATNWGMFGQLGELFKGSESFDVYVCPRCGHVELFVTGVPEEVRQE